MPAPHDSLQLLKSRIARIERPKAVASTGRVKIGHAGIEAALGGGFSRGQLHEVFAAEAGDAGSATGFAAVLALLLKGSIVWLREEAAERQGGCLYAAGLVEAGIDPADLILAVLPDPLAVLRAAADVVRCPDVGVVVIELWRNPRMLDLTATRRLALAAETSGVTAIMLRIAAELAQRCADAVAGGIGSVRSFGGQCAGATGMGGGTFASARAACRGCLACGVGS